MKIKTFNPIKIEITGKERFEFLQNLITNDLNKEEEIIYSYLLTPQGKILSELQIKKENNFIEIYCTNDQVNIFNFFQKYAKLSDVLLEEKKTFINNINEQYFIDLLSQGYIDSNILPHSRFNPSEISPSYIDYKKGCYIGQEVVSRMKHRQLNKKTIKVFQGLTFDNTQNIDNLDVIIKIGRFYIIRLPINSDFGNLQNTYGLKKIDII
jgi:folate-binding protein YgfZ